MTPRIAWLGLPAAVLASHTAAAQVIETYLPTLNGTFDNTVLSRPQREYETEGVNVGSFVIRPLLQESFGYDSNVNQVPGGSPSPLLETQASVGAESNFERNSIGLSLGVDQLNYLTQPRQNETNWSATLSGSLDIGQDKLFARYSHQSLTEREGEIGAVNLSQPLPFTVDDFRVGYLVSNLGQFSITPDIDVSRYRFANTLLSNSFAASVENRTVLQAELVSRYEFSPQRDAVLVLRGTDITFDNLPAGTISPNSLGFTVLAGLDYAATGIFRYRILVGYQVRNYVSRAISGLSAPTVEASVIWSPTRLTSVTLTARNDIQDAADQTVTGLTYTAARLSVDHEYLRDVRFNAFIEAQHGALRASGPLLAGGPFAETASTQDIYDGGVGVTVLLNRNMQLSAQYVLSDHSATGVGTFLENVMVVSLSFRL